MRPGRGPNKGRAPGDLSGLVCPWAEETSETTVKWPFIVDLPMKNGDFP